MEMKETHAFVVVLLAALLRPGENSRRSGNESGSCIYCYQCNSTDLDNPFQCQEYLTEDIDIEPQSCEEVYNAAYCIKHTGRFEGISITCYDCNGDCPKSAQSNCTDVFEAIYCVKETGTLPGGVGTRRYCSSVDMGNYCNYIRQPGDAREYRSCVFTCDTDGCNPASSTHYPLSFCVLLLISALLRKL